jgi:hypothetical protein
MASSDEGFKKVANSIVSEEDNKNEPEEKPKEKGKKKRF